MMNCSNMLHINVHCMASKIRFEKTFPLLERQLERHPKRGERRAKEETFGEENVEKNALVPRSPLWTDVEEEGDEMQELENRLR